MASVVDVSGNEGKFNVLIRQKARYVNMSKCIACGICAEKCPKKVDDSYNQKLIKRKAIFLQYPQAVPLKYAIDEDNCIYFKNGKCRACEKFCPSNAIDFEDKLKENILKVGSIILAQGFEPFNPSKFDNYNYSNHPNIITSMEMERILSASGPTNGHLIRMSDNEEPKKIAWLQCVGSRDINKCDNSYCSSVCCMYAIKEALIAKEHAKYDLECTIFFMDMRTHGKEFEQFYNNAKKKGIRFIRSRIHTIDSVKNSNDLSVRYISEDDNQITTKVFDQIVLSVGLQINQKTIDISKKIGIELTKGNFCKTDIFNPTATSRKGIYVSGVFQGPKDIPQSIIDSSAAASAAGGSLSKARNTLTPLLKKKSEKIVDGERPRIGVFICMCGSNISGIVDISCVKKYANTLPYVEYTSDNLYACSKDSQDIMVDTIIKNKLNRIVVAACTPKTHEALFQETILEAGLNKYLFEMCNIRNHVSWVHKENPKLATEKAKDLIKMAIYKVALMHPLEEPELNINKTALVIGGGVAGMSAANSLATQGYKTHIIEKSDKLGGNSLYLYKTNTGKLIQKKLSAFIKNVEAKKMITIHLNSKLNSLEGFIGNFKSEINSNNQTIHIDHGVAVIATGASQYKPSEYMYGQDHRIITSLDLDKKLISNDPSIEKIKSAVFIQCVGSREQDQQSYCSRVCCTHSINNAIELKNLNKKINIYILYRDIRTYGEKEYLYTEARKKGIFFIRYDLENKPEVKIINENLVVRVVDHILKQKLEISTDIITLASSIIPNKNQSLAQMFKVPLNNDGFFVERHAKLGPSEFSTDGVFLCGLSHYPKPIDEAVAQGQACASRATTILSKDTIHISGTIAKVQPDMCSKCGTCVSICPYSATSFIDLKARINPGKAQINPVLCKGCGLCTASCRSGAINLMGFDNDQIFEQIFALTDAG